MTVRQMIVRLLLSLLSPQLLMPPELLLRWEFIKKNNKRQKNTLSTKISEKPRYQPRKKQVLRSYFFSIINSHPRTNKLKDKWLVGQAMVGQMTVSQMIVRLPLPLLSPQLLMPPWTFPEVGIYKRKFNKRKGGENTLSTKKKK